MNNHKRKYEVLGKRVDIDLEIAANGSAPDLLSNLEASINDALLDARIKYPSARMVKLRLDVSEYECYVSVDLEA